MLRQKRDVYIAVGIGALFIFLLGLAIGLTVGFLTDTGGKEEPSKYRQDIHRRVQDEISADNIRNNLRELTRKPHVAGTPADYETAESLRQIWLAQGLDSAELIPYTVLLQHPSTVSGEENRVEIIDTDGTTPIFTSNIRPDAFGEEDLMQDGIPQPYNAYAAPGDVTDDLVYVNYCTLDDLDFVRSNLSIDLSGKIFLARYGGTGRSSKVQNAYKAGAQALILYSDPDDYSVDPSLGKPYPDGMFFPNQAAQRGSIFKGLGDPLTPGYPSIEGAYRLKEEEADLPKIPVHPIGFADAENLLRRLTGPEPPPSWRGKLNTTYQIGPGFKGDDTERQVRVVVNSITSQQITYNVIGTIQGEVEPDRYVIIGNHRDAWGLGAIDPTGGTATLMEITRVFGKLKQEGNRPRRTLMFGSWGSEEFGLIGSVEWVEEYYRVLSDRTVAYLNLDIAVAGNWVLRPSASPHLSSILLNATKMVMEPNPSDTRRTIFDSLKERTPDYQQDPDGEFYIRPIGAGSDYYGFLYYAGIPCISAYYFYDQVKYPTSFYSLYHTQYETFRLVDEFIDPGFGYHRVMGQLFGDILVTLGNSPVLPFEVRRYAEHAIMAYLDMNDTLSMQNRLEDHNLSLTYLHTAIREFFFAAHHFQTVVVPNVDQSNVLEVRAINDQMMYLERIFIAKEPLYGQPNERHVMFTYPKSQTPLRMFPSVVDAMENIDDDPDQEDRWREVERQLSILTHTIDSATAALKVDTSWRSQSTTI